MIRALIALVLIGCGGAPRLTPTPLVATPPKDAAALAAAVDAYYLAEDVVGLRAAVAAAAAAGPDSALHHEVAADLAHLEDRRADELQHLLAAMRDPAADATVTYLHRLAETTWTFAERDRVEQTLASLAVGHPDPEVAAFAGWMLAHSRHLRGDDAGRDAALGTIRHRLRFAIIGSWDNDQGKGFDAEQPPEREVDLQKTYPVRRGQAAWRTDYTLDPRGKLDLAGILDPTNWQVAYAATGVKVKEAGDYELRISTSDPVKVWVNENLVFEGRRLDTWLFDAMPVPVKLRAGQNRILVKSAQQTGGWLLVARLTGPGGAALPDGTLEDTAADLPYATGAEAPSEPWTEESVLEREVGHLPEGSVRRAWFHWQWASRRGLATVAVALGERFVGANPRSLRARFELALSLWNSQERGRTADLLNGLLDQAGAELPLLALKQARFWRQQKLDNKARELLAKTMAAHPERPGALMALAELMQSEGWHEDRCQLLERADARWPGWPDVRRDLGDCYEALKLFPNAQGVYEGLLARIPSDPDMLSRLHWQAQGNDEFEVALSYAQRLTRAWPHKRSSWARLAETLRRAGDRAGSEAALRRLVDLAPDAAQGYAALAALSMQYGERDSAVALWKQALAKDPENESLANRLAWLAPEEEGPWAADVPGLEELAAAVHMREKVVPEKGTNIVYLMDDEVTSLGADGSTWNVVTTVAHAVNQQGRDALTLSRIRGGGRSRILHAFVVDAEGRRIEASSIRGRAVRFRQLDVGSTVVLQYRIDQRPDGYLAGHMARQWWFQGPSAQTSVSRWVLWVPTGTPLLEHVQGPVQREEKEVGDRVRVSWTAVDTKPLIAEPAMPTIHEVASHLVVSTVPGWDMFWKWEQALLQDAFRDSPELVELAKKLSVDEAGREVSAEEKVRRIHAYLMTRIRYQQDYERHIAGVKPHAAPVVVARQYGDCKDKAVLFITLARLMGVKVHFALVRTRDAGPVRREVPMQQFNHAIVYVPKQEGIAEGRFFDPTVDALDVDVLRQDDQGTWSLVFDPEGKEHTWRQIPYQASTVDYTESRAALKVAVDGSAEGRVELVGHGRMGDTLRRTARNPEQLAQLVERQMTGTWPGARVVDLEPVQVTDVHRPAGVKVGIRTPHLGRREGRELRIKLSVGWSPQQLFSLAERRHDLVLGSPRVWRWRQAMELPAGAKLKRLPPPEAVESACLVLRRETSAEKGEVVVEHEVEVRCERIPVADYAAHRADAEKMLRMLDEELVLEVPRDRSKGATARR